MIPFGALVLLAVVAVVALTGRKPREYVGKRRKLR